MNRQYSENMKRVMAEAEKVAKAYYNPYVGTEHVLYGLIKNDNGTAGKILRDFGVTTSYADSVFSGYMSKVVQRVMITQRTTAVLNSAQQLAYKMGCDVIRTEHVLYCLIADPSSTAAQILIRNYRVNFNALVMRIRDAIMGVPSESEHDKVTAGASEPRMPEELQELGIDLTQKARENRIDPIIGRSQEIERIIQILCRRTKNNPVLIGEPGVGKSAVVEGLAKAVVEGNVPEILRGKIILSLDIGRLVSGTKYRGALEEKLKNAIDLIREQGNIIVFIDELHTLAQAGSKDGEVSPSDILKPYLARGELQTIGATTTDEYRRFIERDPALERRFQPVIVAPPSVEDTIEILKGLKENYETYHKVKISDDAIVAAAKLSDRYIMDRFLPDKAIDLIDEAMSRVKVSGTTVPPSHKAMEEELKKTTAMKNDAVSRQDFAAASNYKNREMELQQKINDERIKWAKENEREDRCITAEDVATIVSKWTGVPVTRLNASESQRLMQLEEILHKRVIGQDEAVRSISKAIRRARAGLKDPNRPVGSFLFLGPTGVGKTALAKALADALFDDEANVIRIDMSEYMEKHSTSRLIGAPPGYVGYDEGGQLTEAVRRKPYSVILFDEIEKAHPEVSDILLQLLDDGRLTDSQGRTVDFKNTVVIMTSNLGSDMLLSAAKRGEETADTVRDGVEGVLHKHFKPEFLNRIDDIVLFTPLGKDAICSIVRLQTKALADRMAELDLNLEVTPEALSFIADEAYTPEFGARPVARYIQKHMETQIARMVLSQKAMKGATIVVDTAENQLLYTVK